MFGAYKTKFIPYPYNSSAADRIIGYSWNCSRNKEGFALIKLSLLLPIPTTVQLLTVLFGIAGTVAGVKENWRLYN